MNFKLKYEPEVLAPAGDIESLNAAILYGADAVYLGGEIFGMRNRAANFTKDLLEEAIRIAHKNHVKIYLTCNTIPTNDEVTKLPEFLDCAQQIGVDALIISDIGTIFEAKKFAPNLPVHISTQAGVVNYKTAIALSELGASRIILARELSLEDISIIRKKISPNVEIEFFVHGAICLSFSGRCLLSQYLANRDANRGMCAQPCRWRFNLVEETRNGQYFPIIEKDNYSYILNSKDLCLIRYLDLLVKSGVNSFKIEGRCKSSYYVSVVTNAYRLATDILKKDYDNYHIPDWIYNELIKVSHRHYFEGFLFGKPDNGQFYENSGYVRNCEISAIVKDSDGRYISCIQKNKFSIGDTLEILQPKLKPWSFKIEKILDENRIPINSANHSQSKIYIKSDILVKSGSILRKKI